MSTETSGQRWTSTGARGAAAEASPSIGQLESWFGYFRDGQRNLVAAAQVRRLDQWSWSVVVSVVRRDWPVGPLVAIGTREDAQLRAEAIVGEDERDAMSEWFLD